MEITIKPKQISKKKLFTVLLDRRLPKPAMATDTIIMLKKNKLSSNIIIKQINKSYFFSIF
tara:strand:+ start:34 stop:216 length:183 start_codon:yes stop_codon:yes gene_type:complete